MSLRTSFISYFLTSARSASVIKGGVAIERVGVGIERLVVVAGSVDNKDRRTGLRCTCGVRAVTGVGIDSPPVLVVARDVTIASRWSMRASVDAVVASSLAAVAAVDADMVLNNSIMSSVVDEVSIGNGDSGGNCSEELRSTG